MTKLRDKKTYKNIKEGGQFLTTIFSHFLHDKVYLATTKYLARVWQCGCGCFSNSFSCRNACQ
jgi:hypothetical protein